MALIVLPVSTLFRDHPESAQTRLLHLADAFELRDFAYAPVPKGRALYYHAHFGLISPEFAACIDNDRFWGSLRDHGVERFSLDFGPAAVRSLSVFPLAEWLSRRELLEQARRGMDSLRRRFHGDILLENLPYYRTGLFEHVCDPDFLAEALEALDAGLLLDLAHAEVSASNLGVPLEAYLDALPLHRVRQIHLSRTWGNPFVRVDAHELPGTPEFLAAAGLLDRIPDSDVGLTIEYYKDVEALAGAYRELIGILRGDAP